MAMKVRARLLSIASTIGLLAFEWSPAVCAAPAATPAPTSTPTTTAPAPTTPTTPTPPPVNLNLGSTAASVQFNSPAGKSVTINSGGTQMTVTPNMLLTPAQVVAAKQVLYTGQQSLVLSGNGAAVGGSFNIGMLAKYSPNSSISIPQGVSALDNFAKTPTFNISGNLSNSGSLYAFSTSTQTGTASFSANNITNQSGGLITTANIPTNLLGGLVPITHLNLQLNALQNVYNAGVISSAGNLNINAGGSITNATAAGGNAAMMQAANNINLNSGAGSIINSGVINSVAGNINVLSGTNNIAFNNTNGVVQALAGNIVFGNPAGTTAFNINLTGGNWLSQQLNAFAGTGDVEISVDQVSGVVNTVAGVNHFAASTPELLLGNQNISGDPTWYNASGDVVIDGNIVGNANVAIIASGNIVSVTGAGGIDTSTVAAGGNGGAITLVAGAQVAPSSTNSPISANPGGDTSTTITVTNPAGGTGGGIFLAGSAPGYASAAALTTITSAGMGTTSTGGNITMIAYAGSGTQSGTINLPNITVNSSGSGPGRSGGNVNLIAGATSGTSISAGSFNATGTFSFAGAAGGNVTLTTATPTAGSGVTIVNGAITSGGFSAGATQNASVNLSGSILTEASAAAAGTGQNGGNISVTAGNAINIGGNVWSYGGGGGGGTGGNGGTSGVVGGSKIGTAGTAGGAGGTGGNITLTASGGNLTVSGSTGIDSSGGSGGGGGGGGGNFMGQGGVGGNGGLGGAGGAAGAINLTSGGNITISGSVISKAGAAGGVGGAGAGGTATQAGGGGGGGAGGGSWGGASAQGGGGGGGGSGTKTVGVAAPTGGTGGGSFSAGNSGNTEPGFTEVASTGGNPGGDFFGFTGFGGTGGAGGGANGNLVPGSTGANGQNVNAGVVAGDKTSNITLTGGAFTATQYKQDANYMDNTTTYSTAGFISGGILSISGSTNPSPANIQQGIGITENGTTRFVSSAGTVTPAEWVALWQTAHGGQTITLGTVNGGINATGGTFTTTAGNDPGFNTLKLPSAVTDTVTEANLTFSGAATINGAMNFTGAGARTLQATSFSIGGSVTTPAGAGNNLVIQTTGNGSIGLSGAGSIAAPGNNVTLTAAGSGSITELGSLVISGSTVTLQSGAGGVGTGSIGKIANPVIANPTTLAGLFVKTSVGSAGTIGVTDQEAGAITVDVTGVASLGTGLAQFGVFAPNASSLAINAGTTTFNAGAITLSVTGAGGVFSGMGGVTLQTPVAGGTITLATGGNLDSTNFAAINNATTMNLTSTGGNIGAGVFDLPATVTALTANAPAGSVNITGTGAGSLNLGTSSALTSFTYLNPTVGNGLTSTGVLTAGSVDIETDAGGIAFLSPNSMNSGTVTVQSTGTINVTNTFNGNINLTVCCSGPSFTFNATGLASGITGVGLLPAAGAGATTVIMNAGTAGITLTGANAVANATNLTLNSTGPVNVDDQFAGNINLGASSGSTFALNATNAASGITSVGTLTVTTGLAKLTSGSLGIAFGAGAPVNAKLVQLTSTGPVVVNDNSLGTAGVVTLTSSSSGAADFTFKTSAASMSITGTGVAGNNINLQTTAANTNISLSAPVTAAAVPTITAAGSIFDTNASVVTSGAASTTSLTATTGSIGTGSNNVFTSTATLSASAPTGNVFVNNNQAVSLASGNATGTFSLNAAGTISVPVTITGIPTAIVLQTSSNGGILIGSSQTTSGTISLNANGTGVITTAAGSALTAPNSVVLTSNNGAITIGGAVTSSSGFVTINSTGTGAINVNNNVTANGAVSLTSAGNSVSVGNTFTVTGSNITIGGNTFTLNASGALSTAGTVYLIPTAGETLSIAGAGTFNIPLAELAQITANTVSFGDPNTTGNITVGAVTIDVSGSGAGKFNLTFNGNGSYNSAGSTITLGPACPAPGGKTLLINVSGAITQGTVNGGTQTAAPIVLAAPATLSSLGIANPCCAVQIINLNGKTLTIDENLTFQSGGLVVRDTAGGGSVVDPTANVISAPNVAINIGGGAIGAAGSPIITTSSGQTNLSSTSTAGGVFLQNNSSGGVNLGAASAGTGAFQLTAAGPISQPSGSGAITGSSVSITSPGSVTLNGGATSTGTVLVSSGGSLNVGGNVTGAGALQLFGAGSVNVNAGAKVSSTGSTIMFGPSAGNSGPLNAVINGTVTAPGTIGFNSGAYAPINLSGSGSITSTGPASVMVGTMTPGFVFLSPGSGTITIASSLAVSPVPLTNGGFSQPATGGGGGGGGASLPLTSSSSGNGIAGLLLPPQGEFDVSALTTKLPTDLTFATLEDDAKTLQGGVSTDVSIDIIEGETFLMNDFDTISLGKGARSAVDVGAGTGGNTLVLNRGNVLFSPNKDIVVHTREGAVHISAGSSAIVMETGNDSAVLDLHESHPHGIQFVAGNHQINLFPGRELVLTQQKGAVFANVNPAPQIPVRRTSSRVLPNGVTAFISEFSIPAAAIKFAPLSNLMNSTVPSVKRIADRIFKTSAILANYSAGAGPYAPTKRNGAP